MCLVVAGLWITNFVVWHFLQSPPNKMPDIAILRLFDMLAMVGVVISLALYWYSRRSGRDPRLLLNLGLGYELLVAYSGGLLDWAYNMPMGVSWIASAGHQAGALVDGDVAL